MPKDTLWIERAWSRTEAEAGWIESQWTQVGDFRMHARVSTSPARYQAPVVVLVHGIGITSRYWVPTSILLAPWFRNYAPDLPGFGFSDKPHRTLHVRQLADWLAAWMHARHLRKAALVGNSFGCQIVADFAVRHPDLVSCTVHIGPTTDPQGQTAREQVRRWQRNNPGEPFTHKIVSYRDYWDCGIPRILDTFAYSLEDHIERNLPRIRVPSLVVRGSCDPIVPQRWAEEATRLLPIGRLVVIPGAYHTVNFSSPLELVRVMVPFLKEVGRDLELQRDKAA
jgi:2-hydroxy-6-oxonona-2,4-dienedioate hydrolase